MKKIIAIILFFCMTFEASAIDVDTPSKLQAEEHKPGNIKAELHEIYRFSVASSCAKRPISIKPRSAVVTTEEQLKITIYKNFNCTEFIENPRFEIGDSELKLYFNSVSLSGAYAACMCGKAITYTFFTDLDGLKIRTFENGKEFDHNPDPKPYIVDGVVVESPTVTKAKH